MIRAAVILIGIISLLRFLFWFYQKIKKCKTNWKCYGKNSGL